MGKTALPNLKKNIIFSCISQYLYLYLHFGFEQWIVSLYSNNKNWIDDEFCCVTTRQQLIPKIYTFFFSMSFSSDCQQKWNNRQREGEKRNKIKAHPFNGFITIWKHVSLVSLRNINEHSVKSSSQSFNFINFMYFVTIWNFGFSEGVHYIDSASSRCSQ